MVALDIVDIEAVVLQCRWCHFAIVAISDAQIKKATFYPVTTEAITAGGGQVSLHKNA